MKMFDILMYLFENYVHSEMEVVVDHDELTDELTRAGFHEQEIGKALAWLERLADLQDSQDHPYLTQAAPVASFRAYTPEEQARLDVQCRGFLLYLEQIGVLDFATREMVIDRVMELDTPAVHVGRLEVGDSHGAIQCAWARRRLQPDGRLVV